jgi:hypothetical protein
MMRNKGIEIQGFRITPSLLRTHLQSNGVSSFRLRSLLNPNDKQDVVLGYSLLKEIWSLPPSPPAATPIFVRAREALRIYGQFARHLIFPYICVDLNLDEQLTYLSTAAHLALYLEVDNAAHTHFMPNPLFIDIMILVKNAYYCVAKAKVDNPAGKFYLILLGTDRLETLFGLIRTAVGTDANVDVLQLGSRASGLMEVGVILSVHPEWDHSPRRLKMPAVTKDPGDVSAKVDHISPASWQGDVSVASVNLQTCWLLGRRKAVQLVPEAEAVLDQLNNTPGIDMLSPFGTLMVNQRDLDNEYDCSELQSEYPNELCPISDDSGGIDSVISPSATPYTMEGDIEDAMAEEHPRGPITADVTIQGREMTKPKALRDRMMFRTHRASTDRLKRVQNVPCFNGELQLDSNIISFDSQLGGPCLRIGNPVGTLVRCKDKVFLAIAQVNQLCFASESNLQELGIHLLPDSTAKVSFQVLRLLQATAVDDPEQQYDWCWSLGMDASCDDVPGWFVHPVNPAVSLRTPGKPTFLFESSFLLTLAASLHQELLPQDIRELANVRRSDWFPYRHSGEISVTFHEV